MSRHARRGRHPHAAQGAQGARPRPATPAQDGNGNAHEPGGNGHGPAPRLEAYRPRQEAPAPVVAPGPARLPAAAEPADAPREPVAAAAPSPGHDLHPDVPRPAPDPGFRNGHPFAGGHDADRPTCTAAQLRRFIKSRPWIPMHELRRRFGIYGGDDDVTPVRVGGTTLYIGLPATEARLMGELLAGGDVGYELSLDPGAPIVVGVYPMRPVARG